MRPVWTELTSKPPSHLAIRFARDHEVDERSFGRVTKPREVWLQWIDVVLDGIRAWTAKQRPRPGSQLEQAIGYMDKRWNALTLFRDNPAIWLDNNGTERALRLAIQGRKNHYGSRSELTSPPAGPMVDNVSFVPSPDDSPQANAKHTRTR